MPGVERSQVGGRRCCRDAAQKLKRQEKAHVLLCYVHKAVFCTELLLGLKYSLFSSHVAGTSLLTVDETL
jgi:hypothetical protein